MLLPWKLLPFRLPLPSLLQTLVKHVYRIRKLGSISLTITYIVDIHKITGQLTAMNTCAVYHNHLDVRNIIYSVRLPSR